MNGFASTLKQAKGQMCAGRNWFSCTGALNQNVRLIQTCTSCRLPYHILTVYQKVMNRFPALRNGIGLFFDPSIELS